MPEFSHEDIKNAILHPGDAPAAAPHVDAPESIVPAPDTVHEGFISEPPTPAEKQQFDQARARVRDSHPRPVAADTIVDTKTTAAPAPNRKKRFVVGTAIAGTLLGGGIVAGMLTSGKDAGATDRGPSDKTTSSTPNTQPTPIEQAAQPSDFELTATSPEQLPDAVAAAMTKYITEPDDAKSDIMLQGIFGDNPTKYENSQKLIGIWKAHRAELQDLTKRAKNLGDDVTIVDTLEGTDDPVQLNDGSYRMSAILSEDTNLDDLFHNNNYDTTDAVILTATLDNGTFHLISLLTDKQ